jgi:hypothetical protein
MSNQQTKRALFIRNVEWNVDKLSSGVHSSKISCRHFALIGILLLNNFQCEKSFSAAAQQRECGEFLFWKMLGGMKIMHNCLLFSNVSIYIESEMKLCIVTEQHTIEA